MDDLTRIEKNYGSVAEYNRSVFEKEEQDYWNSLTPEQQEKQRIMNNKSYEQYKKSIAELEVAPDPEIKAIKEEYEAKVKEIKPNGPYKLKTALEVQELGEKYISQAISFIENQYGVTFKEDSQFGSSDPGKFSVSIEKPGYNPVKYLTASNLDVDTFYKVYSNMREMVGYRAFPTYRDTLEHETDWLGRKNDLHFVTGCSVGELRHNYFPEWAVEEGRENMDNIIYPKIELNECIFNGRLYAHESDIVNGIQYLTYKVPAEVINEKYKDLKNEQEIENNKQGLLVIRTDTNKNVGSVQLYLESHDLQSTWTSDISYPYDVSEFVEDYSKREMALNDYMYKQTNTRNIVVVLDNYKNIKDNTYLLTVPADDLTTEQLEYFIENEILNGHPSIDESNVDKDTLNTINEIKDSIDYRDNAMHDILSDER